MASEEIERLQAFLRAAAAPGRDVVAVPPFTAYFHPSDSLRYLNYAIPESGACPSPGEIAALREAFRARGRLPRLEWLAEAAPAVVAALEQAGLREELRAPLMACADSDLVETAAAVESLTIGVVGDADAGECRGVQGQAFGQEVPIGQHGGGSVLARAAGEPVAAASWTAVADATAEIVGVATIEAWRRRGLAGAVTAAAAREVFRAGGTLCVLSPGDEGAERVYARAGFRPVATMLHWSDPE